MRFATIGLASYEPNNHGLSIDNPVATFKVVNSKVPIDMVELLGGDLDD